ncbi:uncharacterized protein Z520_09687 [Fonsecaea multimorphosa CBS 102226]|uniref:Uncharacterized protein n=1 Tax=Fonsecaea multimorphosa CBS 102226 TaxID=1442371 RepID=A0A0D2IBW5_9EURO|nr:uncharacterized protein Z520_09687 [Fonsecaea multimorphosa CBS 102226]KIX94641.1 hypothetical protein Z520_09687 [Fonsecaea multimorphosa CBS 102226]OAL20347.1 hypothetical protein AYO22_09059 [Fonsecaea multimorphosa]
MSKPRRSKHLPQYRDADNTTAPSDPVYNGGTHYIENPDNSLALTRNQQGSGTSFDTEDSMSSHPETGIDGSAPQDNLTPPESGPSHFSCAEIVLRDLQVPMVTMPASGPATNASRKGAISINGGVAVVNGIVGANICGQFIVGQP